MPCQLLKSPVAFVHGCMAWSRVDKSLEMQGEGGGEMDYARGDGLDDPPVPLILNHQRRDPVVCTFPIHSGELGRIRCRLHGRDGTSMVVGESLLTRDLQMKQTPCEIDCVPECLLFHQL